MEPFDEKKYELLDEYLKDISSKINLGDKKRKKLMLAAYCEVFGEFRKRLIASHKFFELFKEVKCSGSHANGTKIGDADEFDEMMCIKLPKQLNVEILDSPHEGYVQLKTCGVEGLKNDSNYENKYRCIEKWLDHENFILQNKFRNWYESILQKTFNKPENNILKCGNNEYSLSFTKSNPAFCLNVKSCSNESIEFKVDLVPNFYFKYPQWSPICEMNFAKYTSKEWFLIAKRVDGEKDSPHWREVFPMQEIEILSKKNHLKSTLRFIKQLRDKHEMRDYTSYYITTQFLWEIDVQGPNFWDKRLSFLFMHMLEKLRYYLERKDIPSYWYSQLNLLENVKLEQLEDYLRKINNILKAIDKHYPENPQIIINILIHGINKLTIIDEQSFFNEAFDEMNLTSPVREEEGHSDYQSLVWNQKSSHQYRGEEEDSSTGPDSQAYPGNTSQNQMDRNNESNVATGLAIGAAAVGVAAMGLWLYRRYNDRR